MAGFRQYSISIMLILLFIFFSYSFVNNFLSITNPSSEVLSEKYGINSSVQSSSSRLSNIQSRINQSSSDMGEATEQGGLYFILVAKEFFSIPIGIFSFIVNSIVALPKMLFTGLGGTGSGDLLVFSLGIIISILVLTWILLAIKFVRTGESER